MTADLNLAAERAVLGAALVAPCWPAVRALVDEPDIEAPQNRAVFGAMDALAGRGVAIDPVTVSDELRARGASVRLEGGDAYLVDLAREAPIPERVPDYAAIVLRRASLRRLAIALEAVNRTAGEDPEEAQRHLLEAQRYLTDAQRGRARRGVAAADLVDAFQDEVEARQKANNSGEQRLLGLRTSLAGLDRHTGGWRRGTLNVIAARVSIGKTSLVCQTAIQNAIYDRVPTLLFSLEMAPMELMERFFARMIPINSAQLLYGDLNVQNWKDLFAAGARIKGGAPIEMSTTHDLAGICAEARAFRVRHRDVPILVAVDYLQKVQVNTRGRSREQEVAEVSGTLKALALNELDAPIVVPAQLNRDPEKEDREPRVSDIRDSGAVEQDADVIAFIVRRRNEGYGAATLKLGKNRNGKMPVEVPVRWIGETYTLADDEARAEEVRE